MLNIIFLQQRCYLRTYKRLFFTKITLVLIYALFLVPLERRARGDFLGASVVLEKNQRFFFKNTLAPIGFLKGRLLSEAKNSPLWSKSLIIKEFNSELTLK
jgi:hypothetical protein